MATAIRYCEVDGCDRRRWGNGLCQLHYARDRRAKMPPKPPRPPKPDVPCSVDGCNEWAAVKGLCRIHYARQWNKARYVPVPRKTVEERFWAKVNRAGSDDCWEWTAAKMSGYGMLGSVEGKHALAHRFAYELHVGPIPPGHHVHHTCENRACVNPAHLEALSPKSHVVATWIETLEALGYTVIAPGE